MSDKSLRARVVEKIFVQSSGIFLQGSMRKMISTFSSSNVYCWSSSERVNIYAAMEILAQERNHVRSLLVRWSIDECHVRLWCNIHFSSSNWTKSHRCEITNMVVVFISMSRTTKIPSNHKRKEDRTKNNPSTKFLCPTRIFSSFSFRNFCWSTSVSLQD